jgi:hypothetical protein
MSIGMILLILALVCFLIATFAPALWPRINLVALRLALCVLYLLFGGARVHP